MGENNIERVEQHGDRLYFINKHANKNAPLDSNCKNYFTIFIFMIKPFIVSMPVPDKKLQIRDEDIPNLRQILNLRIV